MPLLSRPLELHDVRDVEAWVGDIVRRSNLELSFHEHEDLVAYLLSECWLLSERYEPGIIRNGFSSWARRTLSLRTIDWVRAHRGRTKWQFASGSYERPRPKLVSLDGLEEHDRDRLGGSVASSSMDSDETGFSALMRTLDDRGRSAGRRNSRLG